MTGPTDPAEERALSSPEEAVPQDPVPAEAVPQDAGAQPGDAARPAGPTGHPAVDAALRGVAQVSEVSPAEQIPAYQAAHRVLQETLAGIDEE